MNIWAHTLVKNEAKWLWYAVSSVTPYLEKIMIWDTGSTDRTLEVIDALSNYFPGRIEFKSRPQNSPEEFALVRQEMLDQTKSDWFLMIDGDEIWWEDSIRSLTNHIYKIGKTKESIIVPTINLVGDIFHYQDKTSGNYNFGKYNGHYNLRAVNRDIEGLKSLGKHGIWGWVDKENKMIQDRDENKMDFLNAPYLHATNLVRSDKLSGDLEVAKRKRKLKYEIGVSFPLDFYYPEILFEKRPNIVKSPWETMTQDFKIRAYMETPLRKLKRRFIKSQIGY